MRLILCHRRPAGKQKSKKPGFLRRADSEEDRGNDDLEDLELGFSGRPDILQASCSAGQLIQLVVISRQFKDEI